jgi:hypothetical protein
VPWGAQRTEADGIALANEYGLTMIFTGRRHSFRRAA